MSDSWDLVNCSPPVSSVHGIFQGKITGVYIHFFSNFFVRLSIDGHLGCFYTLAVINNAAMNTRVHISFFFPDLLLYLLLYIHVYYQE